MSDNDNDQHDQSFGFGDDIDNIEALSDNGEFEKMMDEGPANDDDEDDGLPVLIRYDGQPTEEGFVFRKIPAMPADADTTPYFSDEFIAACLDAHETHCAMPRRLFEDIERVALHEEKLARQAARRATFKGLDNEVTPGGSSNASPTLSHRRSVTETTTTTRSPSVGNFSNLFSSALFAASSPLGGTYGSPQYLTSQSSFRPSSLHRSVDDATRDDDASSTSSVSSMDEWRKTVVVPPRSPSPPPADPGRRESDVPLSSFLPAIHGASSMRSPLRASVSSAAADERRLEPIEVLYANRLLSSLTTVDVDALAAKGIVELIRLKPGLEIAREGEPSYATHALIIVNGGATLMRRGKAVSTFSTQCHVLLEEECRGSPGSHRSLATLVVAEPDGLQAWAVPRVLVQRITMAVQVQRRRVSRRQEPSS